MKTQRTSLVPAPRRDLIDVFERVLTRGIILEVQERVAEVKDVVWVHVTIAGVDVFKVEAGLSWKYLVGGADEEEKN